MPRSTPLSGTARLLRSSRLLLLGALLAAASAGCGPRAPAGTAASTPGTSLFEDLDQLEFLEGAEQAAFDEAGAALLTWILKGEPIHLERADWIEGPSIPPRTAANLLSIDDPEQLTDLRLWHLRPPVDLDLPLSVPRMKSGTFGALRSAERALPPDAATPVSAWFPPRDRQPLVWWNPELGRLEAIKKLRPERLTLAYAASLGPFPSEWQWWLEQPAAPRLSRVSLGPENRQVLGVPAASRLGYATPRLDAAALDVGFALTDMGLRFADGVVRTRLGPAPAATFAVEVSSDDGRKRVFEQRVTAESGFVDARVDLSAWKGDACRVELVVEGATADDSLFAMWSTPRFRDPRYDAPERPHIVFLDLDTLRADGLSCYGNPRPTSPNIDAWAAREAVRFADHTSASNWTLPSTVTMLTGLAPQRHGVFLHSQSMDAQHKPLAMRLAELGYETLARTEAGIVTPSGGFDTGFERFVAEARGAYALDRDGWDAELDWLRRRDSARPVFLFLQTYNIHGPFVNDARFDDPDAPYSGPLANEPVRNAHVKRVAEAAGGTLPERDARYLRDVYDAGVWRVDESLGPLFEALPEIFGDEDYVVVLTSDHGEELFERGVTGHGHSLHRELVQTPLIVRAPGQPAGTVIDAPVSSVDVVPTVLALAGAPRDPELPGRDLFADRLPADATRIMQHDNDGLAVQILDWKLIDDASSAERTLGEGLYNLGLDPQELNPSAADEQSRRTHLVNELRRYRAANPLLGVPRKRGGNGDAALQEQLRQLGYLGDN